MIVIGWKYNVVLLYKGAPASLPFAELRSTLRSCLLYYIALAARCLVNNLAFSLACTWPTLEDPAVVRVAPSGTMSAMPRTTLRHDRVQADAQYDGQRTPNFYHVHVFVMPAQPHDLLQHELSYV
jgi:hypothetical protein